MITPVCACCPRLLLTSVTTLQAAEQDAVVAERGKTIYQKLCADCHGANGQGVKDYFPDPLTGDRSLIELTVVADTMPEGEADRCRSERCSGSLSSSSARFPLAACECRNDLPHQVISG